MFDLARGSDEDKEESSTEPAQSEAEPAEAKANQPKVKRPKQLRPLEVIKFLTKVCVRLCCFALPDFNVAACSCGGGGCAQCAVEVMAHAAGNELLPKLSDAIANLMERSAAACKWSAPVCCRPVSLG